MALSHGAVCVTISAAEMLDPGSVSAVALSWMGVVGMYAFTVAFAATWGPVVWVYQNEVLPLRVRAIGTAIATLMNWCSNAIIGKIAPLLLEALGAYTYAIFAVICAAMTLFSIIYIPETRGLSLEAMEDLFSSDAGNRTVMVRDADGFGVCAAHFETQKSVTVPLDELVPTLPSDHTSSATGTDVSGGGLVATR